MRRQVLPTAPSPTTTHFIVCILKTENSKKKATRRRLKSADWRARARPIHALKRVID